MTRSSIKPNADRDRCLIAVVAPLVVAAWGRGRVYAPATVHRLLATRRQPPTVD